MEDPKHTTKKGKLVFTRGLEGRWLWRLGCWFHSSSREREIRSNVHVVLSFLFLFLFLVSVKRKDFEIFAGSLRKVSVEKSTSLTNKP